MKKKFNLRAAVLGAAVLAAGACVSAPALVPSTVMAATEADGATEASDRVTVSRTINFYYKLDDGSVKPVKSSDGGDYKITRYVVFTAGNTSAAELAGFESPVIPGYTADKPYIEPIKVTASSKPQDINVYYTQNPENKKTYETESRDLSRKITFYVVRDDGQAVQTYQKTQSATVNRIVTIDGNGKKTYGEWQSVTFSGESVPDKAGYTPSLLAVPSQTATPDDPPNDVNVYYKKNPSDQNIKDALTDVSHFSVAFTDGLGKTLKTQSVVAGASADAPVAPTREGYIFDGWDKSFTSVRSNLTVNAKWKANKTEIVNDSRTVRRTISYFYSDGKPVISTEGKPASEYYQWTFNRTGIKDTVTGKVTWSDWSGATTFPEKAVMSYTGYTPNIAKVPAKKVDYNSKSWEIKVYYTKNGSKTDGSDSKAKFTGYKIENGICVYYKNGTIDKSLNGLSKSTNGKWYYFKSGCQDKSYTGMAKSPKTGKWYYVKNGVLDYTYTGMAKSPKTGKWYYMKNGVLDKSYTGIAKSPKTGKWYYMKKGVLDYSFTGVCVSPKTGKLVYMKNGVLNNKYSGTVKIGKTTYRVKKGVAVPV